MPPKEATIKVFRVRRFKTDKQPVEASLKLVKIEATAAEVGAAATEIQTAATKYKVTLNRSKRVNVVQCILY